jgi:uncharacterized protein YjbI with pentapeptide repeats
MYGADMYGADMYGADMYGADMYGADMYGADTQVCPYMLSNDDDWKIISITVTAGVLGGAFVFGGYFGYFFL